MKVSPFEVDAGHAERPVQPFEDPAPRTATAARHDDEDEQRREETIEEPGYGHGV